MRFCLFFWLITAFLWAVGCGKKDPNPPPLSPQQALQSFRLSEDFNIELFVAEPQVVDPVEMVFDENGIVYVAEMLDYPEDPPHGKPARSRIKRLEDTDGDGKYDRVTIFADRLLQVSGLLPWKGGLLVTSAPDILLMKDTNGDGRADERRILYTGFPKVNPEARITNLRLGLDNWIYAANNGSDGRITSPGHPERPPVLVRGADFRFQPDLGLAEPASGPAQFGLSFDDWGNRFITQNTIHLRHVIVPMHYLARAPLLPIPAVAKDISDHGRPSAPMFPLTQPQAWRVERTRLRQQRYDEQQLKRTELVSGYFTGASGGTVYNGDVFPPAYWGNVFTGDVSGNLVHRDVLTPDGVTFIASRPQEGVEFLASTDVWFRPCNFANAPDGNLYLLDIYRLFIETPESIPEELKKNMDFWAGDTQGRIYRITPKHPLRRRDLKPRLGAASTPELVQHLANTNGWHRQTAQRLLVERQDRAAVPLLINLLEKSALPQARLHSLWTLEGLSSLEPSLVMRALADPDARVREHGLRLSEGFLWQSPSLANAVLAMSRDADLRVLFQLAFTLGEWKDPVAQKTLAYLVTQQGADPWFRTAILSSVAHAASPFFRLLVDSYPSWENAEFLGQLAALIGAGREPIEIARFLKALGQRKQPAVGLRGLAKGLNLAGVKGLRVPGAEAALAKYLGSPTEAVRKAAWENTRYLEAPVLVQRAVKVAQTPHLTLSERATAIRSLGGGAFGVVRPVLSELLASPARAELHTAVVDALLAFEDSSIAAIFLDNWKIYSPDARSKVVGALLERSEWMRVLLKAIQDGWVERAAIDGAARTRLMDHPEPELAQQARHLFRKEAGDRQHVVQVQREVLKMAGHVEKGRQVFEANCAQCHLPRRQAGRVGPDLSGISNKTKEELLTSILDPSYAIDPRFINYIVKTKEGRLYHGILAQETPSALTLRGGTVDGDVTILRQNVSEIRASSLSLMPDGLEMSMSRQDLADVIAYLRGR